MDAQKAPLKTGNLVRPHETRGPPGDATCHPVMYRVQADQAQRVARCGWRSPGVY